jgi:hypothetical protein
VVTISSSDNPYWRDYDMKHHYRDHDYSVEYDWVPLAAIHVVRDAYSLLSRAVLLPSAPLPMTPEMVRSLMQAIVPIECGSPERNVYSFGGCIGEDILLDLLHRAVNEKMWKMAYQSGSSDVINFVSHLMECFCNGYVHAFMACPNGSRQIDDLSADWDAARALRYVRVADNPKNAGLRAHVLARLLEAVPLQLQKPTTHMKSVLQYNCDVLAKEHGADDAEAKAKAYQYLIGRFKERKETVDCFISQNNDSSKVMWTPCCQCVAQH